MGNIFISYRREDSSGWATGLARALRGAFGDDNVFFDLRARPGLDFIEEIERRLSMSKVALVVIGPDWLKATDGKGQRRLDNPSDLARTEVAHALKRNIAVIPVLVGGADMPSADELPDDLKSLARRQSHELTDRRWDYDQDELIKGIKWHLGDGEPEAKAPSRPAKPAPALFGQLTEHARHHRAMWIAGLALILIMFLGGLFISAGPQSTSPQISRGQSFDPKLSNNPPPNFAAPPMNAPAPSKVPLR